MSAVLWRSQTACAPAPIAGTARSRISLPPSARANAVAVSACLPEALAPGRYDVLVANILAQPLIALAPLIAAHTERGACIALAGVLEAQAEEVVAAYAGHFVMTIAAREESWALLSGARR